MGVAAHSAYDMFSWYKYLSVILVFPTPRFVVWEFLSDCAISIAYLYLCQYNFSHLGFWSGNFVLIMTSFDHCLLLL